MRYLKLNLLKTFTTFTNEQKTLYSPRLGICPCLQEKPSYNLSNYEEAPVVNLTHETPIEHVVSQNHSCRAIHGAWSQVEVVEEG